MSEYVLHLRYELFFVQFGSVGGLEFFQFLPV